MENTIKDLQAQVAALHLFAISLIDNLPEGSAGKAGQAFQEYSRMMLRDLQAAGLTDSRDRFAQAVEDINSRSPSHPAL